MKILLYGLNYEPESVGIGKYSSEMARWLVAQGHQLRVITAPPYFPAWRLSSGYRNRYALEKIEGVRVRRCPLGTAPAQWFNSSLHLASFALTSLGPLLAQRRWRPDVVITVAPAFFVPLELFCLGVSVTAALSLGCTFRILSLMPLSSWGC